MLKKIAWAGLLFCVAVFAFGYFNQAKADTVVQKTAQTVQKIDHIEYIDGSYMAVAYDSRDGSEWDLDIIDGLKRNKLFLTILNFEMEGKNVKITYDTNGGSANPEDWTETGWEIVE